MPRSGKMQHCNWKVIRAGGSSQLIESVFIIAFAMGLSDFQAQGFWRNPELVAIMLIINQGLLLGCEKQATHFIKKWITGRAFSR